MGVISDVLAENDAPVASDPTSTPPPASSPPDPFLHDYRTDRFDVTDEAIDRGLTVLVALTNLL